MLIAWNDGALWLEAALAGMADPWAIGLALALTTLLLEDVAIAAGVALAVQGSIGWGLSLFAVGGGIALGDLGLYGLGAAARRVPALERRWVGARTASAEAGLRDNLAGAVLLARVVPGLRLVTYVASGFLAVPFAAFAAWVALAVALWTAGLYGLSLAVGHALMQVLPVSAPVAVALPVIAIAFVLFLVRRVRPAGPRPGEVLP